MAGKKILVIEDDRYVRENIQIILSEEGYDVSTTENGKLGIDAMKNNSFDLVLCDILMPHVGGFEVLKFVKEDKASCNIPFIFLTAKIELENVNKALNMGASNYLIKPFQIDDLLNCVTNVLNENKNT